MANSLHSPLYALKFDISLHWFALVNTANKSITKDSPQVPNSSYA